MRSRLVLFLIFALIMARSPASQSVIDNLADAIDACQCLTNVNRRFKISGRLVSYYRRPKTFEWIVDIAQDNQTKTFFELNSPGHPAVNIPDPHLNDLIELSGILYEDRGELYTCYTEARTIAHAAPDDIRNDNPHEFLKSDKTGVLFRLTGTIRDFFRDESDPNFIHASLMCDGEVLHAMIYRIADEDPVDPVRYIGAKATVSGLARTAQATLRRHVGRFLLVSGLENVVLSPDTESSPSNGLSRVEGDVLCVWQSNHALLTTREREITKVRFLKEGLPRVGQRIIACGIPETDLYFMNLVNATWELVGSAGQAPTVQDNVSMQDLLFNETGSPMIKIKEHGQTIRLVGVVRHLPQIHEIDTRFHIESSGRLVPVDVGANREILKGLVIGSKVSVTGTCVLDIDSYGIGTSIPQARGFFLVLRTPDDLVVLSRPSWWTPLRLLVVIGALILLIAAILVWNVTLRRLAERRGRELAEEQVNRAVSDLKVYERTHLAVELHDSLSQTLSGVSMQIDAVGRFADTDRERMRKHLGIASKTLKSCRDELRNCLSDLRSSALEERDKNEAIRQTLEPYSDDAAISIRFFIPREILSDSTAHTILSIIRELVVNAIRHGHADKVKVAGALEDGKLLFSVTDNGCGFDTESVPGLAEGHFGLQGIRERVDGLDGNFEIESKAGRGSKAKVSIHLPKELNEEKS